jgi:hypothetical protein
MIFEWRTYDLQPGAMQAYLAMLQSGGLAIVRRHLPMIGYWVTETGGLNRLHHLWAYRDLDDRGERRDALGGESDWTDGFIVPAMQLVQRQRNSLLELVESGDALRQVLDLDLTEDLIAPDTRKPSLLEFFFSEGEDDAPRDELLGLWRVVSGYRVGACLGLRRHRQLERRRGLLEHELLRPVYFSPLG